jgi:hypothetical protein
MGVHATTFAQRDGGVAFRPSTARVAEAAPAIPATVLTREPRLGRRCALATICSSVRVEVR